MAKFAKLFELGDEQVLLKLNYDADKELAEVIVSTDFDGFTADLVYGFKEEEKAQKMFDDYTEEDAIKFRRKMEAELLNP